MSCTTGYLLMTDGRVLPDCEWGNAWRGAMALWNYLATTYLDPKAPIGTNKYILPSARFLFDEKVSRALWDLPKDPTVPGHLRVAELTTFDRAILRRSDFLAAADALDRAHRDIGGNSHLDQQAAWLREHANDANVDGAAWQQTSVSQDLWTVATEDGDDCRPYDVKRDTGHWFIEIPADDLSTAPEAP